MNRHHAPSTYDGTAKGVVIGAAIGLIVSVVATGTGAALAVCVGAGLGLVIGSVSDLRHSDRRH